MGNCLLGGGIGIGVGEVNEVVIKVVTRNGGIMEFCAPITVEFITDEFPGHGIFRSHDLFWQPLAHHEVLHAGEYYLLPLEDIKIAATQNPIIGHVRSNSVPQSMLLPAAAPYRMSFDSQGILKRSHTEVFSRSRNATSIHMINRNNNNNICGFWKVKLVISPQHLLEILSQDAPTQELIESVRTVAKCRNGFSSMLCSLSSSSRNASSNKDALLLDF